jgi:hypothetical protein
MTPEQRAEDAHEAFRKKWIGDHEDMFNDLVAAFTSRPAPANARIAELEAEVARLTAMLTNPPTHDYWGAGEPDCPRDLKSGNGECWRLRCKVCGLDNPLDTICRAALNNQEAP